MATETHIHAGGGVWRELDEFHIHAGGGTWRDLDEAYVHAGGGVWRKIFEKVSCDCTGASIDAFSRTWDATGCTCQTTPKVIQQTKVCCRWNYSGDTACQEMQIQYNVSGGSYVTAGTCELDQSSASAGSPCSGATYEGYWSSVLCRGQTRQYRGRILVKGVGTVCDTSATQGTTSCLV